MEKIIEKEFEIRNGFLVIRTPNEKQELILNESGDGKRIRTVSRGDIDNRIVEREYLFYDNNKTRLKEKNSRIFRGYEKEYIPRNKKLTRAGL